MVLEWVDMTVLLFLEIKLRYIISYWGVIVVCANENALVPKDQAQINHVSLGHHCTPCKSECSRAWKPLSIDHISIALSHSLEIHDIALINPIC